MQFDALQCGNCTPGMILKTGSFLNDYPHPTTDEIIEAMVDNLCPCGSHVRIVQAIQTAAQEIKSEEQS